jgi:hypothetical protein
MVKRAKNRYCKVLSKFCIFASQTTVDMCGICADIHNFLICKKIFTFAKQNMFVFFVKLIGYQILIKNYSYE